MISIIIPCYNEEKRLRSSIEALVQKLANRPYEIIIVNDGSTDNSARVISELEQHNKNISHIDHTENKGKGQAVKTGILASRGDRVLFLDADASQSTDNIELLITTSDHHEFIIGKRNKNNAPKPFMRKMLSLIWRTIAKITLPKVEDTQCGFKCFSREKALILAAYQRTSRWAFDIEYIIIALENNWEIYQLPITWKHSGDSKFRPVKDACMSLFSILGIFSRRFLGHYKIK